MRFNRSIFEVKSMILVKLKWKSEKTCSMREFSWRTNKKIGNISDGFQITDAKWPTEISKKDIWTSKYNSWYLGFTVNIRLLSFSVFDSNAVQQKLLIQAKHHADAKTN